MPRPLSYLFVAFLLGVAHAGTTKLINCGGPALPGGILADSVTYTRETGHYVGSYSFTNGQTATRYTSHAYTNRKQNWEGTAYPAGRVFSVAVNGVVIEKSLDVWSRAGGRMLTPVVLTIPNIRAPDGMIRIELRPIKMNTMISGIDIESGDDAKDPAPLSLSWRELPTKYPKHVFEAQGAILGSNSGRYLVVIGGFFQFPGSTGEVWQLRLDAENAKWERLAHMPQTLTHMAVAPDGEELCGVGGFTGPTAPGRSVKTAWCFHRGRNSWRRLPDLPASRAGGGLVRVRAGGRNELVFSGGMERPTASFVGQVDREQTWALDMNNAKATWRPLPDMPDGRNHLGATVSCGRYYFIGGQHRTNEESGNSPTVSEWLPTSGRWSDKPPPALPIPLGHTSASVMAVQCGVLVVGGITNGRTLVRHALFWKPGMQAWRYVGIYPNAVATPVCGVLGKQVWCATGGEWRDSDKVHVATIS